ncbi:MAG: Rieske 2Fe-2S domain-containing protein, partial [Rhodospirillaceae bacterium]|nr:Rieske 2Fe-2S domain-containing protein [Rhodospirillaceae bacterium]
MASRYYTDPAIFEEEMDKIFACSWIFVGHESQVAEPGSYKTIEIADESIALVRGRDGELRCFYNVCQHRA